eukprot:TRINITY_DN14775_c0_g1_i13.p1 TRINITY_DN14775_c0_g1~~TRINITY_DN14775_c0_g1_i13.p1  ORF type:complete len:342 (+),score=54.71 TRINITY_DN14775_c0_g1_i13:498-1523(+)
MKRCATKQVRGIWSESENAVLAQLTSSRGRTPWNDIARKINAKCGGAKTGKQCRERYRNYANPKLEKGCWKPHEKLLFIVLHQIHRNHWSDISRYLNWRSDVKIKNYFYRVVRKASKHVNTQNVPSSFVRVPEKFYRLFSVLTYIREHYLPDVKNLHKLPKYSHKERMILKLLETKKVTEEGIREYQELMMRAFRRTFEGRSFPVEVKLSLEKFKISTGRRKELKELHEEYNKAPLSRLVLIRITEDSRNCKDRPSIQPNKLGSNNNPELRPKTLEYPPYLFNFYCPLPLYGQMPTLQPVVLPLQSVGMVYEEGMGERYLLPGAVQPILRLGEGREKEGKY